MDITPIQLSQIPHCLGKSSFYAKHTIDFPEEKLSSHTEERGASTKGESGQGETLLCILSSEVCLLLHVLYKVHEGRDHILFTTLSPVPRTVSGKHSTYSY